MTHKQMVTETLRTFGPLSSYGVYHAARARGMRMSPSSVRTRISELQAQGRVRTVGREATPTRSARLYQLSLR